MNKSQKYLLIGAIIFLIIMGLLMWDFGRKTSPPWERHKIKQHDRQENRRF